MKFIANSLLLSIFFAITPFAQVSAQNPMPGQWLVQLDPNVFPDNLMSRMEAYFYTQNQRSTTEPEKYAWLKNGRLKVKSVSESLNIWLIQQENGNSETLTWLLHQHEVVTAQENHYLSLRSNLLPDDPLFDQQWQYINDGSGGGAPNADLDADLAWSITTGGLTMAGDTIVVAVIDGGVNKTHPDLVRNLWKNWAEIPNDGIDNDGNGYIDDFLGWNVFSQNDNIQGVTTIHGTPVSGIVGASGNNGAGVTGVNWNVKIMFVAGGNLESDLLAAYDYVLRARRKYNQSNGSAGAFVVAANCSWGIDYGMPANSPLWCAAFDALGEAGILSVAATANNPVNVDVAGDLPTTCPSDFLVSVTSLNKQDDKAATAAWGPTNIDLGAYGEGIFTTSMGNQYGTHSGTSFAAPHVAGAIGLLYAAPCPELITKAKSDPKAAAAWAKKLLLDGVVPNPSMDGITVTGGRLNLRTMLERYQDQCASCPPPFGLKAVNISAYTALLKWSGTLGFQSVTLRWRLSGSGVWTTVENLSGEYLLEGLPPCSNVEFALKSICQAGETSNWSPLFGFSTTGCCNMPNFTWTAEQTGNSATISWTDLVDFDVYKILIHKTDTTEWQTFVTMDSLLNIPNLDACASYDIQILGWCLDSWISLSPLFHFTSSGCGACTEKQYCPAGASEAEAEWITSVQVGAWVYNSGWGGGGYQNLTALQASNPQIAPQSAVDLTLTPGFWGTPYKEFFRVFIDFNLDGDFDDPGELAYDPGFSQDGIVVGSLVSPAFNQTGTTRMRVMMKYAQDNEAPPEACEMYNFGQVEDYCIDLVDTQTDAKASADSSLLLKIYPQPATNWVWIDVSQSNTFQFNLKIWDVSGRVQFDDKRCRLRNGALYLDTSHWSSGIYFVLAESEGRVFRGKLLIR